MNPIQLKERFELAIERIALIPGEQLVPEQYRDYFVNVSNFILKIKELKELTESKRMEHFTMDELKQLNHSLYEDILPENYEKSYANPSYATKVLGTEYGAYLSYLYTEIRGMIVYAYENRLFDLTIYPELFLEIYGYFQEVSSATIENVSSAIEYFIYDYSDIIMSNRINEMYNPRVDFATNIILNADLNNLSYLYQFGEFITENEIQTAMYLNSLTEEEIQSIARTYTEGFRMGFINNNIDLSKKSVVNIRYSIGFERIVRAAMRQFEKMGLSAVIYRAAVNTLNKKQHLKIGYYSTSPNKQYDYDHRFDDGLYLDKKIVAKKLTNLKKSYEEQKEIAAQFAGPAVIEIFGEKPFEPKTKEEAVKLTQKQQELTVEYQREASLIVNEYVKSDEYSFTIIAFPVPDIGEQFEAIFKDTVKVNTLDMGLYKRIQQCIIDALDQGEYVRVKGMNENKTDMKVCLNKLENKETETLFENCLADVNIPVGEVFTSPKLNGTEGTLHVTEVYLNDLKYKQLELQFEDGMIKQYTCKNFDSEEENQKFVKENLMYHRETLPIGEFAIGTNTTAYEMGRKYHISHMLPILIAEKTGPHFAVGDTCYKMQEETVTYNPDGKEIKAKDNECSILRKTDITKAYFNCHTDITIPYNELGEITVVTRDNEEIKIIKNGRFVLAGTEELNEAFSSL